MNEILHPSVPDRFAGIRRDYSAADLERLRGSVRIRHTLAELGAARLWQALHSEPYVKSLGAMTGNQAVQMVRAGLQAIYVSGWRLAADVLGVETLVVARTDAHSAQLLTSDIDPRDRAFITGERTPEGFFRLRAGAGVEHAVARGLAYAPYADMLWWETSEPNLEEAEEFAEAIHTQYPGKLLAYNCSPSFNWRAKLDSATIARFQDELGAMGYKFQFVTLAGYHSLNFSAFELARGYRDRGIAAYSELQEAEFAAQPHGYTATRHQREAGTGYFDAVALAISGGQSSTTAMKGSTEAAQFGAGLEPTHPINEAAK